MNNEREIALQLWLEAGTILSRYGFTKLPRPTIELFDSDRRHGEYSHSENLIRINRKLIENHPWRVVLEVLKHELAHHVADHCFGGQNEVAHGEGFKAAAHALCLCDRAAKAACDLISLEKDLGDEHDRILSRAQKLESLAQSNNANEAGLALQRLRELQAKYDIEAWRLQKRVEITTTFIDFGGVKRRPTWAHQLAGMLMDAYGVDAIYSSEFNQKTLRRHYGLEFIGSSSQLEAVEYAWEFVSRNMKAAYKKSGLKGLGNANSFYRSFICGIAENIASAGRVAPATEQAETDSQALVLIKTETRKKIADFKNRRYKRLRKSYSYHGTSYEAAAAGRQAGRETNFNPGLKTGVKLIGA